MSTTDAELLRTSKQWPYNWLVLRRGDEEGTYYNIRWDDSPGRVSVRSRGGTPWPTHVADYATIEEMLADGWVVDRKESGMEKQ